MSQIRLLNTGEIIAECNWGDMHLKIPPGEQSQLIPEPIARKLMRGNVGLEPVYEEIPVPSIEKPAEEPVEEDSDSSANFDLNETPPEALNKDINRVGARPRKKKGE